MTISGHVPLLAHHLTGSPSQLPPNTSITGKLTTLINIRTPEPESVPRFIIVLAVTFSADGDRSDYVAAPTGKSQKSITKNIRLEFLQSGGAESDTEAAAGKRLSLAYHRLKGLVLKRVEFAVGGAAFKGVEGDKLTRAPTIACTGNRVVKVEGGIGFTLALDPPPRSEAPSWLSPTSSPTPSCEPEEAGPQPMAPKQTPHPRKPASSSSRQTSSNSVAGPSSTQLLPITSHMPNIDPILSGATQGTAPTGKRRPSFSAFDPLAQSKKQKRFQGDIRQHPASTARGESEASRSIPFAAPGDERSEPAEMGEPRMQQALPSAVNRSDSRIIRASPPTVQQSNPQNIVPPAAPTQVASPAPFTVLPDASLALSLALPAAQPIPQAPIQTTAQPAQAAVRAPLTRAEQQKRCEAAARRRAVIEATAEMPIIMKPVEPIHIPPSAQMRTGSGHRVLQGLDPTPSTAQAARLANHPAISTASEILKRSAKNLYVANVMGVVALPCEPAKQTLKGHWCRNYFVTDEDVVGDPFQIVVFREKEEELPVVLCGSPILFKRLKIKDHENRPRGQAWPDNPTTWATLTIDGVKYGGFGDPHPTADDLRGLEEMKAQWEKNITAGEEAGPVQTQKKLTPLGDAQLSVFCRIAFKILKVYDNRDNMIENGERVRPALELYISDGTTSAGRHWNHHDFTDNLPLSAVFYLPIFEPPTDLEMWKFQDGTYLRVPNVRLILHDGDALQWKWSDLITKKEEAMGWRKKKVTVLYSEDPLVIEMEKRIQALRTAESARGQDDESPHPPQRMGNTASTSEPRSAQLALPRTSAPIEPIYASVSSTSAIPHSDRLGTTFTDPAMHRLTSLADICTNQSVPNRYKVRARVAQIFPVGKKAKAYATKFCIKPCSKSFGMEKKGSKGVTNQQTYCHSCNDTSLVDAELRYRFLILLTTSPTVTLSSDTGPSAAYGPITFLPVLVSDMDAAKILPALSPLGSSINADPKKETSLQERLESAKTEIDNLLMGSKMNGERPYPTMDWCIESYVARPTNPRGSEAVEGHVVYRMFAMEPSSSGRG